MEDPLFQVQGLLHGVWTLLYENSSGWWWRRFLSKMQQSCLLLAQCRGLWEGNWHLYYFQHRQGISQQVFSCTSSLLIERYPGLVAAQLKRHWVQHKELDVGILSNLVAGSIVTNIQYVTIWESHFVVKFGHDLMVYFTCHPGIFWSIPVNRHVLYLHFVLLLQATGGFRFAYYRQLSVIRAIHVGDNKQCKSVFAFCRTCRLVAIKTIGPVRQRLVKQGSFIPIVNVIWWVPGKSGDKNSFLPGFQFIMGAADSLLPQIALFTMPYLLVHRVINDPYPCQSGWPNSLAKLKD